MHDSIKNKAYKFIYRDMGFLCSGFNFPKERRRKYKLHSSSFYFAILWLDLKPFWCWCNIYGNSLSKIQGRRIFHNKLMVLLCILSHGFALIFIFISLNLANIAKSWILFHVFVAFLCTHRYSSSFSSSAMNFA